MIAQWDDIDEQTLYDMGWFDDPDDEPDWDMDPFEDHDRYQVMPCGFAYGIFDTGYHRFMVLGLPLGEAQDRATYMNGVQA